MLDVPELHFAVGELQRDPVFGGTEVHSRDTRTSADIEVAAHPHRGYVNEIDRVGRAPSKSNIAAGAQRDQVWDPLYPCDAGQRGRVGELRNDAGGSDN